MAGLMCLASVAMRVQPSPGGHAMVAEVCTDTLLTENFLFVFTGSRRLNR